MCIIIYCVIGVCDNSGGVIDNRVDRIGINGGVDGDLLVGNGVDVVDVCNGIAVVGSAGDIMDDLEAVQNKSVAIIAVCACRVVNGVHLGQFFPQSVLPFCNSCEVCTLNHLCGTVVSPVVFQCRKSVGRLCTGADWTVIHMDGNAGMPDQSCNLAGVKVQIAGHSIKFMKSVEVLHLPGVHKCVGRIAVVVQFIVDGLVTDTTDTVFRETIEEHHLGHCCGNASSGHVVVAVKGLVLVLFCIHLCRAQVVKIQALVPLGSKKRFDFRRDVLADDVSGTGGEKFRPCAKGRFIHLVFGTGDQIPINSNCIDGEILVEIIRDRICQNRFNGIVG